MITFLSLYQLCSIYFDQFKIVNQTQEHFITLNHHCDHHASKNNPRVVRAGSYPPVFGAHDQQAALSEGAEGDALAALTVDRFGLLFKHRVQVLKKQTKKLQVRS